MEFCDNNIIYVYKYHIKNFHHLDLNMINSLYNLCHSLNVLI